MSTKNWQLILNNWAKNISGSVNYSYETFAIAEIDTFKQRLRSTDELAIEAAGNNSYVYHHFVDLVAKLVVVNTVLCKVITKSCKKTDKYLHYYPHC